MGWDQALSRHIRTVGHPFPQILRCRADLPGRTRRHRSRKVGQLPARPRFLPLHPSARRREDFRKSAGAVEDPCRAMKPRFGATEVDLAERLHRFFVVFKYLKQVQHGYKLQGLQHHFRGVHQLIDPPRCFIAIRPRTRTPIPLESMLGTSARLRTMSRSHRSGCQRCIYVPVVPVTRDPQSPQAVC
jgi:hypothetical protein